MRKASSVMALCGVLLMLAMLGMICLNIGMRPFDGGIRGVVEAGGYMGALAVGLCMPGAHFSGSHISVGLLEDRLPRIARLAQSIVCSAVGAALLGVAGWEILSIGEYARDWEEYIEGFNISYYGITIGLAAGLFVHALAFAHGILSLVFQKEGDA